MTGLRRRCGSPSDGPGFGSGEAESEEHADDDQRETWASLDADHGDGGDDEEQPTTAENATASTAYWTSSSRRRPDPRVRSGRWRSDTRWIPTTSVKAEREEELEDGRVLIRTEELEHEPEDPLEDEERAREGSDVGDPPHPLTILPGDLLNRCRTAKTVEIAAPARSRPRSRSGPARPPRTHPHRSGSRRGRRVRSSC